MYNDFFKNIPLHLLNGVRKLEFKVESQSCQGEIERILEKTVLVGGKRLRPLLTHLTGHFFELENESVVPYARAIEMVHAASLAHDDVVDNASTRRGKDSLNAIVGNKMAILGGDYLLADVIVQLTKQGNLKLVEEMSRVIMDLAEGEWLQLDAARERSYSRQKLDLIAHKKTSSVMSYCTTAPAILAGHSDAIIAYARKFGENLGLAFQLIDDTLDFSMTSQKDFLLDLENGQVNSAFFYVLEKEPELLKRYKSGENLKEIFSDVSFDEAVATTRNRAQSLLQDCRNLLEVMNEELGRSKDKKTEELTKPLLFILDYLGSRSH